MDEKEREYEPLLGPSEIDRHPVEPPDFEGTQASELHTRNIRPGRPSEKADYRRSLS